MKRSEPLHCRRGLFAGLVVFAVVVAAVGTAAGARAGTVPPAQCVTTSPGGLIPDLGAAVGSGFEYSVPEGVNSVSGSAVLQGNPTWDLALLNESTTTVTNPTITIAGGVDPAVFDGGLPTPTLPSSCGLPSLAPGAAMSLQPALVAYGLQQSYHLGFDSSRTVTPDQVPAGGGNVTVQLSITMTEPAIVAEEHVLTLDALQTQGPEGPPQGITVVSTTDPANLNQGETIISPSPGSSSWQLSGMQLNKPYVFTAVLHVDGPTFMAPVGTSDAQITTDVAKTPTGCSGACTGPGPSVSIPVPGLDGSTPGSGQITFSVDQTNHAWTHGQQLSFGVAYPSFDPALHITRISAAANHDRQAAAGVTFTDDDPVGNLSQYSGTIAWGDGSTTNIPKKLFAKIPPFLGGGFAAGSLHTYAQPGSYVVTVTINDVGGASDSKSTTLVVSSR